MAINYFLGRSREQLEADLEAAQADLAAGKSTTSAGSGLVTIRSQIEITPQRRIEMILKALNAIAPVDYPIEDITIRDVVKIGFSQVDPTTP